MAQNVCCVLVSPAQPGARRPPAAGSAIPPECAERVTTFAPALCATNGRRWLASIRSPNAFPPRYCANHLRLSFFSVIPSDFRLHSM